MVKIYGIRIKNTIKDILNITPIEQNDQLVDISYLLIVVGVDPINQYPITDNT